MQITRIVLVGLCVVVGAVGSVSCGRQQDKLLEEARFALDAGDHTTAITKAREALTQADTQDGHLLLSAGLSGRAGVNLLELAQELTKAGNDDNAFNAIHDALVALIGTAGRDDLREAVSTLSGFAGTGATFKFQLGLLQTIEAFSRPSVRAQPSLNGAITSGNITGNTTTNNPCGGDASNESTDACIVRGDLIAADDNLIDSGIEASNDLIVNIRKSYCVMKEVSGPTGVGFATVVLRDRVRCELDENRAGLVAADFHSANVATCASFNFSSATCSSAGDTSL